MVVVWLSCLYVAAGDSIQTGRRPRVGLVLSGGGAKGIAHVGALKVIEECGLPIDYIGGTSMGSIIGGLYSVGYTAGQLETFVTETNWDEFLTDRVSRRHISIYEKGERKRYWLQFPIQRGKINLPMGIFTGQNVTNLLTELTSPAYNIPEFKQLPTPFLCIGTDIESGTEVVLEYGNLAKAMRASMAIPSVFTPEKINGRQLFDGGLTNNFPADRVRSKGMDILIGVDVTSQSEDAKFDNIYQVMEQVVFMSSLPLKEANKKMCRTLIIPHIPEYGASSFNAADSLLVRGERAAREHYDELKALADSLRRLEPDTPREHLICPQPLPSFYVQKIKVNGLRHTSRDYVLQKMDLDSLKIITFAELNRALEQLKGTQVFKSVVYQINPLPGDAVELQFDCEEQSINLFRVGLHYDKEYKAALLLNLSFRNVLLSNSKALVDVSIGESPGFQLSYFQSPGFKPVGKTIFKSPLSPDWQFQIGGYKFDTYEYSGNSRIGAYSYSNLSAAIKLLVSPSINSVIGGGMIGDYSVISSKINDTEEGSKSNYMYFVYQLFYERDTYNEDYFPTEGGYFRLEGSFNKGVSKNVRYSEGLAGVMFRSNFAYSPVRRWTLHWGGSAGSIFGTNVPPQYLIYLGGMPGRHLRNDIRFVGLNFMQEHAQNAWVLHLNSQVRLWSNIFVTFRTNLGKTGEELADLLSFDDYLLGYGVSVQYNSIVGPLGVTLSSSNVTRSLLAALNVGFWF